MYLIENNPYIGGVGWLLLFLLFLSCGLLSFYPLFKKEKKYFKVICIKDGSFWFTKGKTYEVINGFIIDDFNNKHNGGDDRYKAEPVYSVKELNKYFEYQKGVIYFKGVKE